MHTTMIQNIRASIEEARESGGATAGARAVGTAACTRPASGSVRAQGPVGDFAVVAVCALHDRVTVVPAPGEESMRAWLWASRMRVMMEPLTP